MPSKNHTKLLEEQEHEHFSRVSFMRLLWAQTDGKSTLIISPIIYGMAAVCSRRPASLGYLMPFL